MLALLDHFLELEPRYNEISTCIVVYGDFTANAVEGPMFLRVDLGCGLGDPSLLSS